MCRKAEEGTTHSLCCCLHVSGSITKARVSKMKNAFCVQKSNCSTAKALFCFGLLAVAQMVGYLHLLCDLPWDGDSSSCFSFHEKTKSSEDGSHWRDDGGESPGRECWRNILLNSERTNCVEMPKCSYGYYGCGVILKPQIPVARFPVKPNAWVWGKPSRHLTSLKIGVLMPCSLG